MSSKPSRRSGGGSFTLRQPPVVDIGCNCRRPKLFSGIFSSSSLPFRGRAGGGKPKSPNASSTSTATAFTSTTLGGRSGTTATSTDSASFTNNSLYDDPRHRPRQEPEQETRRRRRQRRHRRRAAWEVGGGGAAEEQGRVARESVPVAVESAEPYEDFRESMVQMVVEKEIYAWDDLNDLLTQFLTLNSPRHHPLILHAFADLWTRNGLFSPPSPCQF